MSFFFFFQAEDGIRDTSVTGVQTCALPIYGFEGPGTVSVRPWLGTKAGGGGVLLAQSVHAAYMLRWIFGDVAQVGCLFGRSEERRVGKECRSRWWRCRAKKER